MDEGCTKTEKAPQSVSQSPSFFAVCSVVAGAVHSDGTRFAGARADAAERYNVGYCSWVL